MARLAWWPAGADRSVRRFSTTELPIIARGSGFWPLAGFAAAVSICISASRVLPLSPPSSERGGTGGCASAWPWQGSRRLSVRPPPVAGLPAWLWPACLACLPAWQPGQPGRLTAQLAPSLASTPRSLRSSTAALLRSSLRLRLAGSEVRAAFCDWVMPCTDS